ncbi:UNVERIFIED_CONTAM: hypothetical protein Sradi_5678600, partial [Sesamum radiatum]
VMVRGRDACWEHCVLIDATRQKVRCNYCQREFSGGVYRMKFHLAQIRNKDIVPCTEVPNDVRDHIQGTIFLRSIDVSGHIDDTHYLFGLLESIVLEVGAENVVQVLTDSADSYAYAGKLIKYPSIFWSPCASNCITKILEDLNFLFSRGQLETHVFTCRVVGISASRRPDAQLIKSMLNAEQFWSSAREAVCVFEPLVKVLRIVQGDMPAMGYFI